MKTKQEAVNALETYYRSKESSGVRAKLQWKAVLAMNAYYKSNPPGGVAKAKREMQVVIDRLQKETGKTEVATYSKEEREAATAELGGVIHLGAFEKKDTGVKKGRGKELIMLPLVMVFVAIFVLWYFILWRRR